ncbi:Telomerase reverse transcriptase [Astathelohania contejeani]|uniref:Telomerase reverse transcriptase n=1 Tax=Astathelohania contejeani TaxID=164912 RepID=A0ABQ7I034_9MICR|nr:Telomerase reverse transcriptase [Thelohania contejeani]
MLNHLGLTPMPIYLNNHTKIELDSYFNSVYIREYHTPIIQTNTNHLSTRELLEMAVSQLLLRDKENVLCSGYAIDATSGRLKVITPNITNNIFKTKKWSQLFRSLGDEWAIFLLTKTTIVEYKNGKYLLLSGNINEITKTFTQKQQITINRKILFRQKTSTTTINLTELKHFFPADYMKAIETSIKKYNKLNLKSIFMTFFKSYIHMESDSILDYSVSYKSLINFLFVIAKKTLKPIFDFYNFRILKSKLSLLVQRNKFETINSTELIEHIRINYLKIYKPKKCNMHEYIKRQKATTTLLIFLFENMFIPILSNFFYCTETSFGKFKVFYFPRYHWNRLTSRFIQEYLKNYQEIEAGCSTPIEFSKFRCIPKKKGFRVITNLSYRKDGAGRSLNSKLVSAFTVLKNECYGLLGNSLIQSNQIFEKLNNFFKSIEEPCYILKLDLKDCFDNIPQSEILKSISGFFKKDFYFIKRYNVIEYTNGILRQRYIPKLIEGAESTESMLSNIKPLIQIASGKGYIECKSKATLIKEIKNMIENNTIYYNKKFYIQRRGIPQGSILSSLLCSLYYSEIDKKYLNQTFKKGMFIRYIDDFLLITPNLKEIKDFLCITKKINLSFNFEKIESNFGLEENIKLSNKSFIELLEHDYKINLQKTVHWCTLNIHQPGYSVKYSQDNSFFNYSFAYKPGGFIRNKMKKIFAVRLFFISKNNSKKYENIYDAFLNYAKRIILVYKRCRFVNIRFLETLFEDAIAMCIMRCQSIGIKESTIRSIASKAFREMNEFLEMMELEDKIR